MGRGRGLRRTADDGPRLQLLAKHHLAARDATSDGDHAKDAVLVAVHAGRRGGEQPHGTLGDGLEHGLRVGLRLADGAENLGGGGLAIERAGQLAVCASAAR